MLSHGGDGAGGDRFAPASHSRLPYVMRLPTLLPSRQAPLDASERQYPPALSLYFFPKQQTSLLFPPTATTAAAATSPRTSHHAARRFPLPPPPGRSFQRPGGQHCQPCSPVLQGVRASPPGRSHLPRIPTISTDAISKRDHGVTTRAS